MSTVELHLRGDLDFATAGRASANSVLHYDPHSDVVTIDSQENRLADMPLWTRRILAEALPIAARCTSCGTPASEALQTCKCGQTIFQVEKNAWFAIEKRLIAYMRTTSVKVQRKWNEALLPGCCTAADLKAIYEIQKGRCYFCGTRLDDEAAARVPRRKWHADHLVPVSRRTSSNWPSNIVATCPRCNSRRGDQAPSALWTLLGMEKGERYVAKRRSEARKFDAQRRILDRERRASVKEAGSAMEATLREEMTSSHSGGVGCNVAISVTREDVYAHLGLLTVGFPGSFHAALVRWDVAKRRKFCRSVLELARLAGALVVEPM